MLLSYHEIHDLLDHGVVEFVQREAVNGSSLDIRLGGELLKEAEIGFRTIQLRERESPRMQVVRMDAESGYLLRPGEFVLAHSIERFHLPLDVSCEFKLKSSLARMGINQLTACWCDPGWHNSHITLELTNCTRCHTVRLRPGDPIGQIVFFRHLPVPEDKSYRLRGRYNNAKTVEGVKP